MRSGWNPSRRNKNIDTIKSGHGKNNKFVIPYPSKIFWENLIIIR